MDALTPFITWNYRFSVLDVAIFFSKCEVWDKTILSRSRRPWTTTLWSIFHTISLCGIPYYPWRSTETNLYIAGNTPEALSVFIHVTNFTVPSMGIFLVLNNLFCDTTGCVTLSQFAIHFHLLCTCLASNINYYSGLQGNYSKEITTYRTLGDFRTGFFFV